MLQLVSNPRLRLFCGSVGIEQQMAETLNALHGTLICVSSADVQPLVYCSNIYIAIGIHTVGPPISAMFRLPHTTVPRSVFQRVFTDFAY